jgi:hypothetical protein
MSLIIQAIAYMFRTNFTTVPLTVPPWEQTSTEACYVSVNVSYGPKLLVSKSVANSGQIPLEAKRGQYHGIDRQKQCN